VVEGDGAVVKLMIDGNALQERDAHDDRKVGEALSRFLQATAGAKGLT
jgi:hypothetical protein